MDQKTISLMLCAAGLSISAAFGFVSDNSSLARSFSQTVALTNSQIAVTVTFTNGGPAVTRGFIYADQVPSALTVSTLSVTLNGQGLTNFTFEAGQDGDVYPGCTPYRWVLEQPPGFTATNPVPSQAGVRIVYSINCSTSGVFNLQQFNWVGFTPANTNVSFGYSENTNQQSVVFVTTGAPVLVTGQFSTNSFLLGVNGVPGGRYVIEASTNLVVWAPIVTNLSPFGFTDTKAPSFRNRFYRGRWLP